MTQELYRSFHEPLGVNNQEGYIVSTDGTWLEYRTLSVWNDAIELKIRFRPEDAPKDLSDSAALGGIAEAVDHGRIPGQVFYRGKWRTPQAMIERYKDFNWRCHCND